MRLDPKDDTTGYTGTPAVVGQFRLNGDGWFNYFGFPEKENSPFEFRPSGQVVKALTYGNLGTGGLSTAGFLQTLPDDHPNGRHIPGFGTHLVEHRAIDPAGNYGKADSYRATVLPGAELACGTTVTGTQTAVNVDQRRDVRQRRDGQRRDHGRLGRVRAGQEQHRGLAHGHRRRGRPGLRLHGHRPRPGSRTRPRT